MYWKIWSQCVMGWREERDGVWWGLLELLGELLLGRIKIVLVRLLISGKSQIL